MSVVALADKENQFVTIKVTGKFDYAIQKDFRLAYENNARTPRIKIDLSETTYIDSAGLGILMAMRSQLDDTNTKIEICRCSPNIMDIFDVFKIDKFFKVTA